MELAKADAMARSPRRYIQRWCHHDYAGPGLYLVTVCTAGRRSLFTRSVDGAKCVTPCGLIVCEQWLLTARLRPHVELDAFAVAADHLHGIIRLRPRGDDVNRSTSAGKVSCAVAADSLAAIVGHFKGAATRDIRRWLGVPGLVVWQRGFHDRLLSDERALESARLYVMAHGTPIR